MISPWAHGSKLSASGPSEGATQGVNILALGADGTASVLGAFITASDYAAGGGGVFTALALNASTTGASTGNTDLILQSVTGATPYSANLSVFGGTGLYEFGDWTEPGTDTFADLTAEAAGLPGGGFTKNCSDCDTPAYAGAACTASVDNAGAQAIYIQGGLYCYGKVTGGGGGGTPGGVPTNLQYNLAGGSLPGSAGSAVDSERRRRYRSNGINGNGSHRHGSDRRRRIDVNFLRVQRREHLGILLAMWFGRAPMEHPPACWSAILTDDAGSGGIPRQAFSVSSPLNGTTGDYVGGRYSRIDLGFWS